MESAAKERVTVHMDQTRTLLNGIPTLQRPCDLDLLVFFAKHSTALLSSEHLARLLGYELKDIARSLDVLVAAGYVTRSQKQNRAGHARMYVFSTNGMDGGPLSAIVTLASSREGRIALRMALAPSRADRGDGLSIEAGNDLAAAVGASRLVPATTSELSNQQQRKQG
jgi:hypothetical protein